MHKNSSLKISVKKKRNSVRIAEAEEKTAQTVFSYGVTLSKGYRVKFAAEHLSLTVQTVRKLLRLGLLTGYLDGGGWMIPGAALREYQMRRWRETFETGRREER